MRGDAIVTDSSAGGPRMRWHSAWPWVGASMSGVLLALSFPPASFGGLIWIALIPLICSVWFRRARPTGRRSFALGYLTGLIFFTATFSWLHALGALFSAPLIYGLPLLLGAYLALYPAVWAWLLDRLLAPSSGERRFSDSWRNLSVGALGACAWVVLEWVRGWLLSGFGWNGLGVALHRDLAMIQIADLTGVLGLTWLVAFVNLMLVIIVRRIAGELGAHFLKRIRWEFSISVIVVVLVFSYGVRTLLSRGAGGTPTAWIAAIQPNIPQTEKFDPAFEDETFAQLERLTLMASATRHDLILWPEAATPRGIFADEINWEFIRRIAANISVPILMGTVEDYVDREQAQAFNTAVLLTPAPNEGEPRLEKYRKMHLVPFGEYLPLRPLLGWLVGGLVPGDISAGSEVVVIDSPVGKLGPLICFEDTLGDLTRQFVLRGAELLVNLTNDGWFLRTAGAEVHLANSVLRAVENRRPLIRCTNTGVTCLITSEGRIDQRLEPHRQGFTVHPVSIRERTLTFYTRRGDWMAGISCAGILLAMVGRWRARATGR